MKKILGLISAIVAILLGSYFAMGWLTERALKKTVILVNQSNEFFVEFTQYNRGWFHSLATIKWRLRIPARITKNNQEQLVTIPSKDYNGSLPIEISHGPIIYNNSKVLFGFGEANIHVTLPKEYENYFNKIYSAKSTKPILDLNVFVNYLNNTEFLANVPEFKLISNDQKTQITWSGMHSTVNLSPKLNQVIAKLNLNGITFVQDYKKMVVGKVYSDCNLKYTKNGLYIGNAHVAFPSILITEKDQTVIKLSQFDLSSDSNVVNSLFHSKLKIDLDQLFTHGSNYGPAHVLFSLKNLDAQALAEINHTISSIQPSTDTERQQLLLSLLPKLPRLLSKGAQIQLSDVKINMPDGVVSGNVDLSLPSDTIDNPFQLLQKIHGDCNLNVSSTVLRNIISASIKQKLNATLQLQQAVAPVAAADSTTPQPLPTAAELNQQVEAQTNAKLEQLVSSGLLVQKDDKYTLDANLSDGHLMVNGKPFTPSMLQL